MTYYANIDSKSVISGFSEVILSRDEYGSTNVQNIEVSETIYNNAQTYGTYYYIYKNNKIVRNPNYETEKQAEENERISHLKCTKRVFVLMLEQLGLDYFEQIEPLINANRQAKLEWELCVELERSNPLLDVIGAELGVTHDQLNKLFQYANGEITLEEFNND